MMELISAEKTLVINDKKHSIPKKERDSKSFYQSKEEAILKNLIEEAGEDVYNYLKRFGFIYNTDIIVLSSVRHYLYGNMEITKVKTVVNLMLMNHITFIEHYLYEINSFLPIGGNFVGCLIDSAGNKGKRNTESNPVSKNEMVFLNSYVSKVDSLVAFIMWAYKSLKGRAMKFLTIDKALSILERNGFQVIDVNEIDGISFLISVKISNVKSRRFEFPNFF